MASSIMAKCGTYKDDQGNIQLYGIRFSNRLITENWDIDIDYIVKHELIHWYTNIEQNVFCGHNKAFKANCKKFNVRRQFISNIDFTGIEWQTVCLN